MKSSFRQIASVALVTFNVGVVEAAIAIPPPPYAKVEQYETTIPVTDDPTDIYYPVPSEGVEQQFPLVLMLQGAFVDKAAYREFARGVAAYGFVVVVPNHERSVFNPRTEEEVVGLLSAQRQVNDVLDFIKSEQDDPASPIAAIVDPEQFGLMGHSHGGAVALSAIRGTCLLLLCSRDRFERPPELDAGVFFGTHLEFPPQSGTYPPIDNPVPIALLAGSEDGVATLDEIRNTYAQIQNPPKTLIIIEGANHYGITNENNPDRAVNPPLIPQAEALEMITHWTGLFLRSHLWGDREAFNTVYGENGNTMEIE
ncbi:MAG: alpha/beta hydrolase family protein [Spirulinaceae cyanobacterium]